METPLLILVLFNWSLKFIFLLIFLPSYILDRESYIYLGFSLDDTWGIKWYFIESTLILIALLRSFLCISLVSSSSSSATWSLMYFSRSFSLRMRPILSFHPRKFSMPSSLSSSLVLGVILCKRSLKNEISQNEKLTLPGDAIDWDELTHTLGLWRFQIFTSQNWLARFWSVVSTVLWFYAVFWSQRSTHSKTVV